MGDESKPFEWPLCMYAIEIETYCDGNKIRKRFYAPSSEEAMKLYLLWEQSRSMTGLIPTASDKTNGRLRVLCAKLLTELAKRIPDRDDSSLPEWEREAEELGLWNTWTGGRLETFSGYSESPVPHAGTGTTERDGMSFTQKVKADGGIGPAMTELLVENLRAGKFDQFKSTTKPQFQVGDTVCVVDSQYFNPDWIYIIDNIFQDIADLSREGKAEGPQHLSKLRKIAQKPFATLKDGTRFMTAESLIGKDICESPEQIAGVIKSASKCVVCGGRVALEVQWSNCSYSEIYADKVELVKAPKVC